MLLQWLVDTHDSLREGQAKPATEVMQRAEGTTGVGSCGQGACGAEKAEEAAAGEAGEAAVDKSLDE